MGETTNTPPADRFESETCGRCGGSGTYSWCQMYGDRCFQCWGKGKVLTRRGAAAAAHLKQLRSRPAADLKPGDRYQVDRYPFGGLVWVTVTAVGPAGCDPDHPHLLRIEGTDPKGEFHAAIGVAPDDLVRVAQTPAARAETLEAALAYQATLTPAGTPRRAELTTPTHTPEEAPPMATRKLTKRLLAEAMRAELEAAPLEARAAEAPAHEAPAKPTPTRGARTPSPPPVTAGLEQKAPSKTPPPGAAPPPAVKGPPAGRAPARAARKAPGGPPEASPVASPAATPPKAAGKGPQARKGASPAPAPVAKTPAEAPPRPSPGGKPPGPLPIDIAFASGTEVMEAIRDGRLPPDTPQKLSDDHPYWRLMRAEAARESARAKRLAAAPLPGNDAPSRRPLTKAQNAYLEGNFQGLASCTLPTAGEMDRVAGLLRTAADALEAAIAACRQVRDDLWPTASDALDDHMADRLEDMLSEERIGARWTVEDLRDVAADFSGPACGFWAQLVRCHYLKPRERPRG
jgi:hypothetical protein